MRAALVALATLLVAAPVAADPLRVVVRHPAAGDDTAVARLAGHVVDLDVEVVEERAALEGSLDAQIAAASALAAKHDAGAVVWFRPEKKGLGVVVATPTDRRVFVRAIDAGDPSATAEAAAQAARTAIRALTLGGTIGVEVPAPPPAAAPPPPPAPRARTRWTGTVGWQVALDRGADVGAQALAQRLAVAHGAWAGGLALTLGPPLRRDGDVAVELARSSASLVIERRLGAVAIGLVGGVVLYHRATVAVPGGLTATDSRVALAAAFAPEVRWRAWRRGAWALELAAGLDVVIGAPSLAVERDGMTEKLTDLGILQPRVGLAVTVEP